MILVASAVAACTPAAHDRAPPELTPANSATVLGSRIERTGSLATAVVLSVIRIDGKDTDAAWHEPLAVAAGERVLTLAVSGEQRTSVAGYHRAGDVDLRVALKPGGAYTIRADLERGFQATLWLEDQNGKRASDRVALLLTPIHTAPLLAPMK